MKSFVRSICELIEQTEIFVMATVVESSGSTPRSSGAKMAIRRDGRIIGTIGGGLMEALVCRDGLKMLDSKDGTAKLSFVDMTQEMAANSDMICGGGLSILLETITPDGPGAAAYIKLNTLMRTGRKSILHTKLDRTNSLHSTSHEILTGQTTFPTLSGQATATDFIYFEKSESSMIVAEPFIPPAPLYIFGAGHVSLFTARVGTMIGFRTVVLDDRDTFANKSRFPEADEVITLPSFDKCCEKLSVGSDAFIIIVTRGHMHDRTVLAEALKTDARYIGMIGSKKKRDTIYASLLSQGFTQEDIDRCHCPIGLSIGAQTPAEIAISIGGELIRVRSEYTR